MAFFHKKSPWEIEWADLAKREAKFAAKRREGPTSVLVQKLDRFVPDKLSGTLNAAFLKAFEIIFEKGTGVIEKTYNKGKRETDFKVNTYAAQVREDRKTVRNFTKQAKSAKSLNLAIASIEGIGLGFVGAGIPDIPLFIAMVLKSVYEIALSYGYSYDTDEEKIFILKVIEAAMCDEEAFREKNEALNEDIHQITLAGDRMPEGSWKVSKAEQMRATSACLSQEMIYTKFLQGQFVIGIAGGIFDPIYVLKYRRRFLESKKSGFTG